MTRTEKILWIGPVAVLVLLGGYLGRVTAPAKEVIKEKVVTQVKIEKQAVVDAATTTVAPRVITRWRTQVVTAPDGTRTETREGERDRSAASVTETQHAATTVTATKVETREVEVLRIQPALRPTYQLGVMGGVQVPALLGGASDRQLVPFLPRRFAGAVSLQRRLFGDVYAGVWGASTGAAGLVVTVGF